MKVYAILHSWYRAEPNRCGGLGSNPTNPEISDVYYGWRWGEETDNPCTLVPGGPSWLRKISSSAYPLIGPYDSRDPEVRRWQIRWAKYHGISGFFLSVYSWGSRESRDLFFGNKAKGIIGWLQLAREEHFKVGIEMWGTDRLDEYGPWKEAVLENVATVQALSAEERDDVYISINGKPVFWIFFPTWMSYTDRLEFLDGEGQDRQICWMFHTTPGASVDIALQTNWLLQTARVQYPVVYNFPGANGFFYNGDYASDLTKSNRPDLGMVPATAMFPGYGVQGYGPYGLRRGGMELETGLNAAKAGGAQIIFVMSGNEWGEHSMLEPGINISKWYNMGQESDLYLDENGNADPYRYLRVIWKFTHPEKSLSYYIPPSPPRCSIVDQILRDAGIVECQP